MKSTNAKICVLIGVFGLIMSFSACNKSKDPGPAVVKFTLKQDTYNENEGTANIEVTLSHTVSKDITIDFTWAGSTTTYLNGDYSLTTATATVVKGQKTGFIHVDIIDDTQIDEDDALTITMTSASDGAKLSSSSADLNFDLTISNNDVLPTNTLQADLTWDTGKDVDIDMVDLDLNLQEKVVYTQGPVITDPGTTYLFSQNTKGFESLLVLPGDLDQVYWFYIPYYGGSGAVDFTLTLNGFTWANGTSTNHFAAGDSGSGYYFIGPFTKAGTAFTFGRSISPGNGNPGKIFTIKGSDFRMKKGK